MNEFMDLIIKFLAALVMLLVSWLAKKAFAWLKSKMDAADSAKLDSLIMDFTQAAEQLLKETDPDGNERMSYVQSLLVEEGYDITEAIQAKIESAVYKINQAANSH